jgi:hypothetical protein
LTCHLISPYCLAHSWRAASWSCRGSATRRRKFTYSEKMCEEVAGKAAYPLRLGGTVTLVTHAAAEKAGLKQVRQPISAIAGLSSGCTMVDSYYMVPVIDRDNKVRSVKAMGLNRIATLAATDVPADIERRFLQTKGFGKRLARPAGDVKRC